MKNYNKKLSNIIDSLIEKKYSCNQENIFYDEFEAVINDNKLTERIYFLILNLVDFYEDAINHNFKNLSDNYTIEKAKDDLLIISKELKENSNIILPEALLNRLQDLYS